MDAASFTGRLLRRGDAQYDTGRALHNGLIDKHPALIAQCRTARDVVEALGLAAAARRRTVCGSSGNTRGPSRTSSRWRPRSRNAPDGSGTPVVALLMCHCGPLAEGEPHASALRAFGSP